MISADASRLEMSRDCRRGKGDRAGRQRGMETEWEDNKTRSSDSPCRTACSRLAHKER